MTSMTYIIRNRVPSADEMALTLGVSKKRVAKVRVIMNSPSSKRVSAKSRSASSVVRHTDRRLFNTAWARETFSRMSFAFAVQMNGFGLALCLSIY
jgi:hypothetical protein